jgi:hypothetical protein
MGNRIWILAGTHFSLYQRAHNGPEAYMMATGDSFLTRRHHSMKLTTHLHLVPGLSRHRRVLPLSIKSLHHMYMIQSYVHNNRKTPTILYMFLLLNKTNHRNFYTGCVTYMQLYMRKCMKTRAHQPLLRPTYRHKCRSSFEFNGLCSSKATSAVLFTKFISFRYEARWYIYIYMYQLTLHQQH